MREFVILTAVSCSALTAVFLFAFVLNRSPSLSTPTEAASPPVATLLYEEGPAPRTLKTRPSVQLWDASAGSEKTVETTTNIVALEEEGTSPEEAEVPAPASKVRIPVVTTGDGLTQAERHALLSIHNRERREAGVAKLAWSDALAESAGEFAETLQKRGCVLEHSGGPYGEVVYYSRKYGSGQTARTVSEVMNSFLEESRYYDHESNSCQAGKICGHYTQIMWEDSGRVGCAKRLCLADEREEVWVCHYDPPGNVVGESPY